MRLSSNPGHLFPLPPSPWWTVLTALQVWETRPMAQPGLQAFLRGSDLLPGLR